MEDVAYIFCDEIRLAANHYSTNLLVTGIEYECL